MTLTTNRHHLWCPMEKRVLTNVEFLAAQEVPAHRTLADASGAPMYDLSLASTSAWARMAGNGMSAPCVGSVLHWISVRVEPSIGELPTSLPDPGLIAGHTDEQRIDGDWCGWRFASHGHKRFRAQCATCER